MSCDKLVVIPPTEWPRLQNLYKKNWPSNIVGYYTLQNFINWIRKDPKIKNLRAYSLNGDWSDGTFLIIDRYHLFANSLANTNERVELALKLIDWGNGVKLNSLYGRFRSTVCNVIRELQLEFEFNALTLLYYLPREKALQFEMNPPPLGIKLKSLTEENAELINSYWSHRHNGSLFLIKRWINWGPTVGAFTDDDRLVAWCLRDQSGQLAALQTIESHVRQGLGQLIVKSLSKRLAECGNDVFACVVDGNTQSCKLFEKLEFKKIDEIYWMKTTPLKEFNWTDD